MEVSSGAYPAVPFMDPILHREISGQSIDEFAFAHISKFVVTDVVEATVEDSPINIVMF